MGTIQLSFIFKISINVLHPNLMFSLYTCFIFSALLGEHFCTLIVLLFLWNPSKNYNYYWLAFIVFYSKSILNHLLYYKANPVFLAYPLCCKFHLLKILRIFNTNLHLGWYHFQCWWIIDLLEISDYKNVNTRRVSNKYFIP